MSAREKQPREARLNNAGSQELDWTLESDLNNTCTRRRPWWHGIESCYRYRYRHLHRHRRQGRMNAKGEIYPPDAKVGKVR